MKKFIVFCLKTAVVMLVAGVVLVVVVSYTKGPEYVNHFLQEVRSGRLEDWMEMVDEKVDQWEENSTFEGYDIDDATMFDKDQKIESGNIDRIFPDMTASVLKIEVGGCELDIQTAEDGIVRVTAENVGKFQAYEKENELRVKGTRKAREDVSECRITLYLPEEYIWQEVDMDLGAGIIRIAQMKAERADLEVEAGQMLAQALKADKLEVSVGAGEIRLEQMTAGTLNVSVGMGNFTGAGDVSGSIEAECSMGNLALRLAGAQSEYDYELECVAGNILLGKEKYSGLGQEKVISNGAGRKVSLECSMGNVEVSFDR